MNTTPVNPDGQSKRAGSVMLLGVMAAFIGFAGCASPTYNKSVRIESEPSGMRVEVNGANLGTTPTSYAVKMNNKGDFAGAALGDSPLIMFTVFPPEGSKDLYKQTKTFSPSAFMDRGDRVPEKIFFDMKNVSGR